MSYSNATNPVGLPPGRAKLATRPTPTGSMTDANTIGTVGVALPHWPYGQAGRGEDDVRCQSN
jgi:hypothetical protein